MIFYFSIGITILVLGAQIFLRSFRKRMAWCRRYVEGEPLRASAIKRLFAACVFLIAFFLIYLTLKQYEIWELDRVGRFLLPPHQPIFYFLFYSWTRFFAQYFIAFIAALSFLAVAKYFNNKYGERFFYREEYWLGALGIFISNYPGFLIYLLILIIFNLLLNLVFNLVLRKNTRVSFRYLWMPSAIFAIIINNFYLSHFYWWPLLKI